ncbi:hypothetical protein A2U01_0055049 [Trifolium medium]|uniref:Uncharacterized protein n=1 Tax=Trifolium medium TaxID=97028 RepID=A0A392RB72_9FABA|nr:hypothetical protein [Trifolium medium]
MDVVRSTLVDVQREVKENHASLIAMLERCLGKSLVVEEGSASAIVTQSPANQKPPEKTIVTGSSGLRSDALTEFR